MWFKQLTGFEEQNPEQVRQQLWLDGGALVSRVTGRTMVLGRLELPTLSELRERVIETRPPAGALRVREVVADVQQLHTDPENAGALFQVASQFNLLEMVSPRMTPEHGVDIYEYDATQGPACAIAAGAGTIYRNYFVPCGDQLGQSIDRQIDCAAELGERLGNGEGQLWKMINGYLLPTRDGLERIAATLGDMSDIELNELRGLLRIGLQWNTQVTLDDALHCVTQAYCSATPVAYSEHDDELWRPLAQLVLEAAYEATCWAALLPERAGPSRQLFLTLLGGGAFGNRAEWILNATRRALTLVADAGYALEVAIVSYGSSRPEVAALASEFAG